MVYSYHGSFHEKLLDNYRWLHLHCFCQFTNCHLLRKCDLFYFWFLLFLLRLRSWLLKSLRDSGEISSSSLIWSVMSCTGILIEFFLLVLILSVALSLAVLRCLGQFRSKYSIVISSCASVSLSAAVIAAESASVGIRSSVSALLWSSLTTLLRTASLTSHRTTIAITLTRRTAFSLWSCRAVSTTSLTLASVCIIAVRKSSLSTAEITASVITAAVITIIISSITVVLTVLISVIIVSGLFLSLWSCRIILCRSCSLRCLCRCFLNFFCRFLCCLRLYSRFSLCIIILTFRSCFTSVTCILCMIYTNDIFFLFRRLCFVCFRSRCHHLFFCSGIIHLSSPLLSPG